MKIVFATHNFNKASEIQKLTSSRIEILTLETIGCNEEIPETAATLEGNASLKANHVWKNYKMNCFADDTGLEVLALNNEPGVFSARYAGDEKDNTANIALVLKKLTGQNRREAQFRTVISLIIDGKEYFFEGKVSGVIIAKPKGTKGFGYDSIFKPNESELTFAEMSLEEKNKISHRSIAFAKMVEFLAKLFQQSGTF